MPIRSKKMAKEKALPIVLDCLTEMSRQTDKQPTYFSAYAISEALRKLGTRVSPDYVDELLLTVPGQVDMVYHWKKLGILTPVYKPK